MGKLLLIVLTASLRLSALAQDSEDNWVAMKKISVRDFVQKLMIDERKENQLHILTTIGYADTNWIQKEDIPYLMTFIDSQQDAKCIVDAFSSSIPLRTGITIGDQVISLIEAYRNKVSFPNSLTICVKYEKAKRDEVKEWWQRKIK